MISVSHPQHPLSSSSTVCSEPDMAQKKGLSSGKCLNFLWFAHPWKWSRGCSVLGQKLHLKPVWEHELGSCGLCPVVFHDSKYNIHCQINLQLLLYPALSWLFWLCPLTAGGLWAINLIVWAYCSQKEMLLALVPEAHLHMFLVA